MNARRIGSVEAGAAPEGASDLGAEGDRVGAGQRCGGATRPSVPARTRGRGGARPSAVERGGAPAGRSQPPPSSARKARSASTAPPARRVVDRGERASRVASSSARHSTASAPCPTCGSITDGSSTSAMRSAEPEPLERGGGDDDRVEVRRPWPSRVAMLPRSSAKREVGPERRRAGPGGAPSRCRRGAPAGRSASVDADQRVARVAPLGHRGEHEAVGRSTDGRSLAECTARSARPSSTASCTSFTNTPLPPIVADRDVGAPVARGRRRRRARRRARRRRRERPATRSACQRASALPARRDRAASPASRRGRTGRASASA